MLTPWQFKNTIDGMFVRVINGFKAICVQPYDEMNKKRGRQWAASRLIVDVPTSTGVINSLGVYYSVLVTGDKPVDLKSREFAHTGTTVIADIFENPVYTGGSEDPIYNACGIVDTTTQVKLLTGITLTDEGEQFAPSIYVLGPTSQQSRGAPNALYGSNYILAANTSYLLKFYSTDPQLQDIAARIEFYDGGLDVPNEDIPT